MITVTWFEPEEAHSLEPVVRFADENVAFAFAVALALNGREPVVLRSDEDDNIIPFPGADCG